MRKIKVMTTKIGLDTHVTGILLISRALKNAGMEVIYLGKYQTPESIVKSAIEESADVIAISSLASNYRQLIDVVDLLKQKNINNIPVIAGGTIPKDHALKLKDAGIMEIFTPGCSLDSITEYITSKFGAKDAGAN